MGLVGALVLVMLLLVISGELLHKVKIFGESMFQWGFVSEEDIGRFKEVASPLEEAIACAYLICNEGCGRSLYWPDLKWTNADGKEVTCGEICGQLPVGERGEVFCDLDSAEFAINVSVNGDGKLNVDNFRKLFEDADDVCILTNKSESEKITGEVKGKLRYIYLKSSNIRIDEETTCEALKTKDEPGKRGAKSGSVHNGKYYIFVYKWRPPTFVFAPVIRAKFLTVCISNKPISKQLVSGYDYLKGCPVTSQEMLIPYVRSFCLCRYLTTKEK